MLLSFAASVTRLIMAGQAPPTRSLIRVPRVETCHPRYYLPLQYTKTLESSKCLVQGGGLEPPRH